MRTCQISLCAAALLLLGAPACSDAGDWPGWRGPLNNGQSDEKDLPLTWGGKQNESVLWKARLNGHGYASPIVWNDRVFVAISDRLTDAQQKEKVLPKHWIICLRASDGHEFWRTSIPPGSWPEGGDNTAIPTPTTDGARVYAWFGTGVAAAVDFDGKIVWRKERAGPYSVYPSLSSSPLLFEATLLLLCDQSKNSFLLALDKKTGEPRWEQKRDKVRSTNSSPLLMQGQGPPQVLVAASNALQGLEPRDGQVRWWCKLDGGYWSSLTYGSGLVYADSGGGRGVAVDPSGKGDVDKTHVKWAHPKVQEGLGSPLIVGDYLYRSHKPGFVKCWNVKTGAEVYSQRLEGISFLSSPFATPDGRIYFASAGKSYVLRAGPKFEVLAVNELRDGGDDGPSPAVSGGRIFVKNSSTLFCIGKK